MEIKNLKRVSERILKAIKNKERIIIYGDADLDGVTSVIILKESIKSLGGEVVAVYFPDRELEGCGISEVGLDYLKDKARALFITVDCGIGNFKEVKLARKLGFEVIIIDHHEILDKLPEAEIVVDPKQKGDKYPFKGLASVGIIFKLSELLLIGRMTDSLRKNFLELVALATIADMMPQKEENKIFIQEGLQSLENSWRPGIKVFFDPQFKEKFGIDLNQKISKIISILNIRDVKNRLPASFRLLTNPFLDESKKIVEELIEKNRDRREKIENIVEEIEGRTASKLNEPIVFEGDSYFELILISSGASIICKRHMKPTFIFKKMTTESHGTVRTPVGIDSVSLMKKCSKYLLTYGGHPQASGFRIKNDNLEKFKECLIANLNE